MLVARRSLCAGQRLGEEPRPSGSYVWPTSGEGIARAPLPMIGSAANELTTVRPLPGLIRFPDPLDRSEQQTPLPPE